VKALGRIGIKLREALVGEGVEVALIDLMIGDKNGPVGASLSFGPVHQGYGYTKLFVALTPTS
jgi:formaldehyde-activating enzyme